MSGTGMKNDRSTGDALVQAERWFVRLASEDCSDDERAEFARWHSQPQHAQAYADTEALWRDVGDVGDRIEIRRLSRQVMAELDTPAPHSLRSASRWKPLAMAASVAFVAVVLSAVLILRDRGAVYTTALGEHKTVQLADGSTVTLNTQTRLEVHFSKAERDLTLARGEALFEVSHDAQRPFFVSAGGGRVRAIGTRFQVRRDADAVEVTLLQGKVAVDRPAEDQHLEMQPGEQLQFHNAEKKIVQRKVDEETAVSWTRGRLIFRATPLADAVAEVNRYARTKITIADPALATLPVSGTFVTGDSEILADALQAEMPIRVQYRGDHQILLYSR